MSDVNRDHENTDAATVDAPRKRSLMGRSPSYPFFDLERSLARAKQLYDHERVHPTNVMTALKHWGYTNPSGKGGMTLSSLKQFGLLNDSGRGEARHVQLSTLAYDILHTPHAEERADLLRQAALTPEIHREMWEEYGPTLPSASSLAWKLTKERNFTTTGAEDFIRQWKRTMEFANLAGAPSDPQPPIDEPAERSPERPLGHMTIAELKSRPDFEQTVERGRAIVDEVLSSPPRNDSNVSRPVYVSAAKTETYSLPMGPGRAPVQITGEFPLTAAEWNVMISSLELWKSMLVSDADTSD